MTGETMKAFRSSGASNAPAEQRPVPARAENSEAAVTWRETAAPLLVGASRGDALTRQLFDALERRFGAISRINTELLWWQRYPVALQTFHPVRSRWKERFWKSRLAFEVRSSNSRAALARVSQPVDLVVQVHALFQTRGAPYVAYIDNTHHQSVQGWPSWNPFDARELERWYAHERATYQQALHLFTMGEPVARSLVSFYGIPADRVTNVGGGANIDCLPPFPLLPAQYKEPVILFVGHDFSRKGGECLLRAFRRVRAQVPGARLRVVGAHVPPEPGVEALGRIKDRQRIAELYAQASIFCLPSHFDPYPLVLMEAMAYGLPCVSTAVCGIPEIVVDGRTGVLTPPGDDVALAQALLRLLRDPSYAASLGAAGRQRVEQHLNWDRVVDRMTPALARLGAESAPWPGQRDGDEAAQRAAVWA